MVRKAGSPIARGCALNLFFLLFLLAAAPAATKPNLILLTLDSAPAGHVGFMGAKPSSTPNLDHLAQQSLVFEHAYAQAPGTVVSHATILSGAYPQSTNMSEIGGTLPSAIPYLPSLLQAHAYHTAAFVSSIELDPRNGPAQGFDRGFDGASGSYDAGFSPALPGDSRPPTVVRSADQTIARAIAWLDHNQQAQFFLWIHLSDPHADAAIGKFIASLQRLKLFDPSAILILAAHGESLGAHGEDSHGIFLYDETIRVPLLIKLPQTQPADKASAAASAVRVNAKARLVDVAPSLLEIAGVPVPSQMAGQSLLRIAKTNADQPVYSRSDLPQRGFGWSPLESWRAGKYLYIRAPKPELYDLLADPGATHNLAQTSKATLDTMASQLEAFDKRFSGEAGKPAAELTSSEMQKLASLGYIGLQKSAGSAAAVSGTDPKDKIAVANKVLADTSVREHLAPEKIIAALSPVVAADANIYLAQYALGMALAQKAQYAGAIKHFHQAIELQPDSAWAHFQMGACLLKTGDYKTAVIHLEIATNRLPEFILAHRVLADAYDHSGRTEDAKKERSKTK
jgi:choline-sulfatase